MLEAKRGQTIGVVIPYFQNWELFLQLFESLERQSFSHWRALVINDAGRPLDSEQSSRVAKDPRVTVIEHDSNRGPARTWNEGIETFLKDSSVSLITIVHADDVLQPDFLKHSVKAHESNPDCAVVHTAVMTIGPTGQPVLRLRDFVKRLNRPIAKKAQFLSVGDKGLAKILRGNFVFCPTMSFKAGRIENYRFAENYKMVLDLDLVSRMLMNGESVVGLTRRLYKYRRHSQSLTEQYTRDVSRFEEEVSLYQQLSIRGSEIGFHATAAAARWRLAIRIHLVLRMFRNVIRGHGLDRCLLKLLLSR